MQYTKYIDHDNNYYTMDYPQLSVCVLASTPPPTRRTPSWRSPSHCTTHRDTRDSSVSCRARCRHDGYDGLSSTLLLLHHVLHALLCPVHCHFFCAPIPSAHGYLTMDNINSICFLVYTSRKALVSHDFLILHCMGVLKMCVCSMHV